MLKSMPAGNYTNYEELLLQIMQMIDRGKIKVVTDSTNESVINNNDLYHYLYMSEYKTFFELAIKVNSINSINLMLNYYQVPEDITMQERISYYQLLGSGK